jgi:pimeloyl-ACP methyl ester carboxylesterase
MAEDLLALLDALGVERALVGCRSAGRSPRKPSWRRPSGSRASSFTRRGWGRTLFPRARRRGPLARLQLGREGFYRALSVWLFTACSQAELVEMIVQRATHHPHPTALHAYLRQTEAVLGHDARDRVHLIRCPTLVAVGSQDLITPPLLAEELASRIPGARLRSLPDVGHGAIWEAPAAFNRVCLDFLDGVRL